LLAQESEIPPETKVVIHMWEDDDGRCVLKVLDANDYVKLVTDYLRAISDVYKAVEKEIYVDGRFVMRLVRGIIAARTLINGGDDFVGVAAGLSNINGIPKEFVLKDQNGVNQGRLTLQWRTASF